MVVVQFQLILRLNKPKSAPLVYTLNLAFMKKNTLLLVFLFSVVAIAAAQITPLNYTNAANWSAHPMKLFDLEIKPSYTLIGADTTDKTLVPFAYPPTNAEADIFVVSPTTLINSGGQAGTTPLDFVQKSAINLAVQLNYSYLGQIGRIYSPYYRQANLPTFTLPLSQQVSQAAIFDTATTDVLAAFEYYMANNNSGRRVILAGHSQGALVLAMMIRRMEANPTQYADLLNRVFLAVLSGMEGGAYALQNTETGGWLGTFPFCQNAPDTACIMAWQTVKEGLLFLSNTPFGNTVAVNGSMVDKTLKFSAYNPFIHEQTGDPLGYSDSPKPIDLAIFPKVYIATGASNVSTDWVAYDGMYDARIVSPNTSAYALAVEKTSPASDERHDPIAGAVIADLHLYDVYFLAGDVLRLIRQKLDGVSSIQPDLQPQAGIVISPNPSNGSFRLIFSGNQRPRFPLTVTLTDVTGRVLTSQIFDNEEDAVDVGHLPKGLLIVRAGDYVGKVVHIP